MHCQQDKPGGNVQLELQVHSTSYKFQMRRPWRYGRKDTLALIWIWNVPSQALILKLVPHQVEQLWNFQEVWPLLAESCHWQWALDGPIGPLILSASLFSVPMCWGKPPLPAPDRSQAAPLWLPPLRWTEGLWIAGKTVFYPMCSSCLVLLPYQGRHD